MKLKQQPEDFQVEELTDITPSGQGPFAFYRLEKKGWTTPDALQAVRRRWRLDLGRVSYGGLKDRHAHTVQYLTIFRGPQRGLTHHGVSLTYLGQLARAYSSQNIRSNRFRVVMRDLSPQEGAAAWHALEEVRDNGVPNYFDDQRFGSVGEPGQFVARSILLGRYEEALHLALAAPYEHDRAPQKKEKALLRTWWGDWAACKKMLPRGHARSLVDYLVAHSGDFRGALARLRPDLRGLYLSAYQSYLWNRMLARWLQEHCPAAQLLWVQTRLGQLPMHQELEDGLRMELAGLRLPLPSARVQLDPGDPGRTLLEDIVQEEGLEQEQFRLKGFREMFFSRGDRAALCMPNGLLFESEADDRHPGRQKLVLAFELPRGAYATLIVKRVTFGP